MIASRKARVIAFYLPQFHPIPENDQWWGPGFTEWTNVARARSLFPGHKQPHVPADLGFYDLRLPETRRAQADMARGCGIEGFCYWHYWFAGKRLLERPFNEVLASGDPDFPFCLGWANETWSGIWHGAPRRILIEQTYPGERDFREHFEALLPAFSDHRYIRVDGKPLFFVYKPELLPDPIAFTELWRELASAAGLGGMHFIANSPAFYEWDPGANGFDGHMPRSPGDLLKQILRNPVYKTRYRFNSLLQRRGFRPNIVEQKWLAGAFKKHDYERPGTYPCVVPNWDNTPRSSKRGWVLTGSSPATFQEHLREAVDVLSGRPVEHRIVFLKSWNEWAESNYVEPDLEWGHAYLDALRAEILG